MPDGHNVWHAKWLDADRLAVLCTFALSLAVNLAMARALGATQILSGEETSVSIRDPLYLELRQQYDPICTNIASHLFYWVGQHLAPHPSLFFGRFEKALAMALVPALVVVYVAGSPGASRRAGLLSGLLLAVMPGFYLFAPLATEYGLECVPGMAALCLARSARPSARFLAAPLASWTALTYGAGVAFVPAIVWQVVVSEREHAAGLRASRALCWVAGFALPWSVPFLIWTNHPHLLTGGGTFSTLATLVHHTGQLVWESAIQGGSYYYFASHAALSQPLIALAAVGAVGWLASRRSCGAVLLGFCAAVGIYVLSGREIGMRRGVPIVVFSLIALGIAGPTWLRALRNRRGYAEAAVLALALSFGVAAWQLSSSLARFDTGAWRAPLDFDFHVLPGQSMPETYRYLLAHPDAVDARYEPERTWAVLRMLARQESRSADPSLFSTQAIAKRLLR